MSGLSGEQGALPSTSLPALSLPPLFLPNSHSLSRQVTDPSKDDKKRMKQIAEEQELRLMMTGNMIKRLAMANWKRMQVCLSSSLPSLTPFPDGPVAIACGQSPLFSSRSRSRPPSGHFPISQRGYNNIRKIVKRSFPSPFKVSGRRRAELS